MNNGEMEFTVYFKNGKRSVIKGAGLEDAFTRAEFRADVIKLVDWVDIGNTDTHTWYKEIKNWIPNRAMQTGEKKFSIYWKHGKHSVIIGVTIEDAFTRAGYGAGALAAVDWYDNNPVATHSWDNVAKEWLKINAQAVKL
jgi:hypothetical protein